MSDIRTELEQVIESAYQDVRGVMAGKRGYRLRHAELADHLIKIFAAHQQQLLDELERELPRERRLSWVRKQLDSHNYAHSEGFNQCLDTVRDLIARKRKELQ